MISLKAQVRFYKDAFNCCEKMVDITTKPTVLNKSHFIFVGIADPYLVEGISVSYNSSTHMLLLRDLQPNGCLYSKLTPAKPYPIPFNSPFFIGFTFCIFTTSMVNDNGLSKEQIVLRAINMHEQVPGSKLIVQKPEEIFPINSNIFVTRKSSTSPSKSATKAIEIDDKAISENHLNIQISGSQVYITDFGKNGSGSTQGVYIYTPKLDFDLLKEKSVSLMVGSTIHLKFSIIEESKPVILQGNTLPGIHLPKTSGDPKNNTDYPIPKQNINTLIIDSSKGDVPTVPYGEQKSTSSNAMPNKGTIVIDSSKGDTPTVLYGEQKFEEKKC